MTVPLCVDQFAFAGGAMRAERRIVDETGRAIGTDRLVRIAHIDENMRMVERRPGADAHEFLDPDLDRRNAWVVVEMRRGVFLGHGALRRLWRCAAHIGEAGRLE